MHLLQFKGMYGYVKGVPFVNRCTKRVPFLSQMVYTRVREGVEPLGGVFPHKTLLMKRTGGTNECIVSKLMQFF